MPVALPLPMLMACQEYRGYRDIAPLLDIGIFAYRDISFGYRGRRWEGRKKERKRIFSL